MKQEKLAQALNEISDAHIADAAARKKKRKYYFLGAIAAVLAVAILASSLLPGASSPLSPLGFLRTLSVNANAVNVAEYPEYEWVYRRDLPEQLAPLQDFFADSMGLSLSGGSKENTAYSPVNLYMALALTAELASGDSRQQILDVLRSDSQEALRSQASEIWNACYLDDGNQTLLANSLWLDEGLRYDRNTMDTLKNSYYTSVYQGDLGSSKINKAISNWLDQQTGGLLKQEAGHISLDKETVLALYSTIFYRAKWGTGYSEYNFSEATNTRDVFHAPGGDIECTYMHHDLLQTNYYWGESYGAVALSLKDSSKMWLILPDEGKTAEDVLSEEEYAAMLFGGYEQENSKFMKVNLSLPKFDIRCQNSLQNDLMALGITDVFDPDAADFSDSVTDSAVWLTEVNQATRVCIDEEGVTAASYIEIPGAGSPAPPEEIIDFVLDRPFLFVITNRYDLPLFAGVVNEP